MPEEHSAQIILPSACAKREIIAAVELAIDVGNDAKDLGYDEFPTRFLMIL